MRTFDDPEQDRLPNLWVDLRVNCTPVFPCDADADALSLTPHCIN